MDAPLAAAAAWWPVVALVLLRPVLGVVTSTAFAAVKTSVDRKLPHDLALSAGEWLEEALQDHGLTDHIDVVTAPGEQGGVDAYFPGAAFIQLSPETWLRHDAVGWGTAAHELGHALNYRRSTLLHMALVAARWSSRASLVAGTTFLVVNLVHASPLLAYLSLILLASSVLLHGLVLADELWASRVGMQLLTRDGRMERRLLDGAHLTMGAAFLSYMGAFLSALALLLSHQAVTALATPLLPQGMPPLEGTALLLAGILTAGLLGRAAHEAHRVLYPPSYKNPAEAERALTVRSTLELSWTLPLIALLILLWDQPASPVVTLAFAIACIPALQGALRLVSPLLPLVMMPLFAVLMPLLLLSLPEDRGEPAAPAPARTEHLLQRMQLEMEQGRRTLQAAQLRVLNEPPLHLRLGALVQVAYVPFLFIWWTQWAMAHA